MATQANITLTVLPHPEEPLPDIPVRMMTLNHHGREVILGRASSKEPRAREDGFKDAKTISRVPNASNAYMSRNETVAGHHAALFLRKDGEVCLEHRAGRFPPTFVNGSPVTDCVTVENNDIINLGPLTPYHSKHKGRTYHPFAMKLNLTYDYRLLSDDESSSSSEEEDEVSVHGEASTHHEHPDRLSIIRGLNVIDVPSSEDDASSDEMDSEDDQFDMPSSPAQAQPSQSQTETIVIDLTENDVDNGDAKVSQHSASNTSTRITRPAHESSQEEEERQDEHQCAVSALCMEMDDMDDDDLESLDDLDHIEDDSIFGAESDAPSERAIERSAVAGRFSRAYRFDFSPEPELFDGIDLTSLNGDSDADVEEEEYEPFSPITPEQPIESINPPLSEELSKFQEEEKKRILEEKRQQAAEKKGEGQSTDTQRQEQLHNAQVRAEHVERQYPHQNDVQQRAQPQNGQSLMSLYEPHPELQKRLRAQHMALHRARMAQTHMLQNWARNGPLYQEHPLSNARASPPPAPLGIVIGDRVANMTIASAIQQPLATPPHQPLQEQAPQPTFGVHYSNVPYSGMNSFFDQAETAPTINGSFNAQGPFIHSSQQPSTEYSNARAENRAKLFNGISQQQPSPPSLLMSGSLFGQPMGAGMTLPALPPKTPKTIDEQLRDAAKSGASELSGGRRGTLENATKCREKSVENNRRCLAIGELLDWTPTDESGEDSGLTEEVLVSSIPPSEQFEKKSLLSVEQATSTGPSLIRQQLDAAMSMSAALNPEPVINVTPSTTTVVPTPPTATQSAITPPKSVNKKRKHVEFAEPLSNSDTDCNIARSSPITLSQVTPDGIVDNTVGLQKFGQHAMEQDADADMRHCEVELRALQREMAMVERPTKRMKTVKKVAERLGYAALGGVAAAVGVFAALVASAPQEF